jgi:NADPH-dependent 2,4-dienoyl-CoA reductase/sulfur reductase-like enzyme/nitrite reductase/ring-hydroxylating ferredoxin subunit
MRFELNLIKNLYCIRSIIILIETKGELMSLKEFKAAKINDLEDGEMKAVSAGDGKEILLTRIDGNYFAFGAHCTHYGGPLAEGILCNGIIMCPWHHACFDAKTGDMNNPPAMDSLPKYETKETGDDVIIMLPDELESSRTPEMVKADPSDESNFIIIGGGASGNAASQALREAGYKGKITIITQEARTPYDRPNLSKAYLSGEAPSEWMPLRDKELFKNYNINFLFSHKVEEVNIDKKEICLDDDRILKYDKVLLATGGIPQKLNIPGSDFKNIFYLRSFDDCDRIIEAVKNISKVVVIGASFIGMEVAFHLHERKLDVTVIGPEDVPFKNIFGSEVGSLIKKLQKEHGVKFKLNSIVTSFEGDEKIDSVVLSDGEKINCDVVVIGIGVKPATSFIKGINLEKDGSIKVDEYLQAAENVFASGDIATFPYNGNYIRIEHWRVAEQQGRIAGFNMAGKKIKFDKQPFFWTQQAGLNIRYIGYAKEWDETITWGDINSKEFITFLVKNNKVAAAIGNNRDVEIAAIEFLMLNNKVPSATELKEKEIDLVKLTTK